MKIKYILFLLLFANSYIYTQNIDSLKYILNTENSELKKAITYNKLSNLYLDTDLDKSRKYVDSALFLGAKIKNYKILSNAYVNYANGHYYKGNLDSTLFYYQKSYQAITKTEDKNEIAAALNRLGLVHEAKSDYQQATQYYYQALEIYEANNYKPGLANIYNNLGVINDVLGKTEKSIQNYTSALNLFKEIKDLDGQANVYNNLATLYADNNELITAISYIKISIYILKSIKRTSETATAYLNASTFYDKNNERDSAVQALDSAIVYYKFTGNLHGIANVLDKEAGYLKQDENYSEAILKLQESLSFRQKVGNLNARVQTLKQLSSTHESNNEFEKALQYYKRYKLLEDSILNENTQKAISEINIKYETAKKDTAIGLLKKEAEIKQFQNRLLVLISIAFGIISILLFYSFRTKSKLAKGQKEFIKQKDALTLLEIEIQKTEKTLLENEIKAQQKINDLQKKELERSKRELATSTMQILNKNKILSEVKASIKKLNIEDTVEKETINKISAKVKENINLDEDWEQFKIHFEKVNIGFFEKLQKQNPNLTSGDLKVCAYLKINLSPKEIAQIMNISMDGINKRLYRIRKKINLPTHGNLYTYLNEF